ncbi:hypothetical protein AtNW77_Chr2g0254951 [Arabidopsis thaliana]|uniref:Uncharacterized protein n=3 Tax=Arabidopsis TaxID=3701 RepID=A0A178VXJ3_ARATH|nr:hypothetical protein ISN45_At02g028840 [Arabidopsis thaliana x Arabidopsis arenosa]KAG7643065.1 hypothetical protein ISN44_As02g029090 [Arabidopsis suecica]KAG7643066.1 hypothetical protein ISN44_As02g029090 [Arabidopsis suecica]OAP10151.1 hypothetical protein AXX17_AT2G30800 [Arabidopsis thaliana]
MPPGAKKRKALKKKQQEQEATGVATNNKGFNGHGHDEHGSQDERDSDGNLSSPGSQGNEEFGTRDPSPPPLSSLGKDIVKEKAEDADFTGGQVAKGEDVIEVGRGRTDHEENGVNKQLNSCPDNFTQTSREADSTSSLEISPALDSVKPVGSSVSKVVMSDKSKQVESSTDSDSLQQKSDEKEEILSPRSAEETNKEIKNVKEYEVPECSKEKSLLPSGPPVFRTSWLSCCGLFDVMAGSER